MYFSAWFQLVDSSSLHRGLSALRLPWLGSHRHAGLVIHGGFWKTHAREACAAQLGDLLEWITLITVAIPIESNRDVLDDEVGPVLSMSCAKC